MLEYRSLSTNKRGDWLEFKMASTSHEKSHEIHQAIILVANLRTTGSPGNLRVPAQMTGHRSDWYLPAATGSTGYLQQAWQIGDAKAAALTKLSIGNRKHYPIEVSSSSSALGKHPAAGIPMLWYSYL